MKRRSRSRSSPRRSSGSRGQTRSRSRSDSLLRTTGRKQQRGRARLPPRRQRKEDRQTQHGFDCIRDACGSLVMLSFSLSLSVCVLTDCIRWGKQEEEKKEEPIEMEKPNFGLTGALAKDQTTGNMQNGVVIKFSEPPEARQPTKRYRLYVFKDDKNIATLHVHRKSAFLVGRDKAVADILTEHPSCSKQHAVLQYRMYQRETEGSFGFEQEVRPYIMDLNSTNSTFLNGHKVESSRYIELKEKDVLKFGESTREYVLMCAT